MCSRQRRTVTTRRVGQRFRSCAVSSQRLGASPEKRPHGSKLAWDRAVTIQRVHIVFQTSSSAPRDSPRGLEGKDWKRVVEIADNRHRRHVLGLDRKTATKLLVLVTQPAACAKCAFMTSRNGWSRSPAALTRTCGFRPGTMAAVERDARTPAYEGVVIDGRGSGSDRRVDGVHVVRSFRSAEVICTTETPRRDRSRSCSGRGSNDRKYALRLAYVAYGNRASNTPVTIQTAEGERKAHDRPATGLLRLMAFSFRWGPSHSTNMRPSDQQ